MVGWESLCRSRSRNRNCISLLGLRLCDAYNLDIHTTALVMVLTRPVPQVLSMLAQESMHSLLGDRRSGGEEEQSDEAGMEQD